MSNNKKAAARMSAAKKILERQCSSDTASQRGRVLEFLRRHGSLSTLDARHLIDVLHPAARIMELRGAGHTIVTVWTYAITPEGGTHRVARYHLLSTPQSEVA